MFDCSDDIPFEMHCARLLVWREAVINDAERDQCRQFKRLKRNTNWKGNAASACFVVLGKLGGPLARFGVKLTARQLEEARCIKIQRVFGIRIYQ